MKKRKQTYQDRVDYYRKQQQLRYASAKERDPQGVAKFEDKAKRERTS
jgi:hypothetical protein